MYRCVVVALHEMIVAMVTGTIPISMEDILKVMNMGKGVARYNPQDRRTLVATLRGTRHIFHFY